MVSLLPDMADRVAKTTVSTVAVTTSTRMVKPMKMAVFRHGAQTLDPEAVIVQNGTGHLGLQSLAQCIEVDGERILYGQLDQTRDGQVIKCDVEPKPRFQKRVGFVGRQSLGAGDAGALARDGDGLGQFSFHLHPFDLPDLNGCPAADVRLPVTGGIGDDGDGRHGQRRQKAHDGNDQHERMPGNGALGDNRAGLLV